MRRAARGLLYLGIVVTVFGLAKYHARYVADPPYDFTGSFRFGWTITYCGILLIAAYGIGLPDLPRTRRSAIASSVVAAGAGAVGVSILQLFTGDALLPRFVVFGSALILTPWYVLCSTMARDALTRAEDRDRVVFVGDPASAEVLAHDLTMAPERPAAVVATLTTAAAATDRGLAEHVARTGASVVVLDRDAQADESVVSQASELHEHGTRIRTLTLFYEQWLGKLPVSELERVSMLFDIGEVHRARYGRMKRLVDVAIAVCGCVAALVVTPLVVVGDLVANRGPLLYRQPRVGKNGRVFSIVKFRTMRAPDGSAPANEWTAENDPRITPFGRFLRRSHLDELPQVLNILTGDLSVVGPRPEQPHYVAELSEKLPFYGLRHLVRPGLTGWAQVKYGYAGDETDALEKLQYEFFYLRRQGFVFDIRIVGRTIRSVLGTEGRGR